MAKAVLFKWNNQNSIWEKFKTVEEVSEVDLLTKYANSEQLSNQKDESFFNKWDCYKDNGEFVGSILSLNSSLFI